MLLILGVGEGRGPPRWQIRAPLRKVLSRRMVVSNLLLWKRGDLQHVFVWQGQGCIGMGDTGFQWKAQVHSVFFRQLEAALGICPERTDLGPLSILLGVGSGSLVWKTVQWGHLLPSPSRTVLLEAR